MRDAITPGDIIRRLWPLRMQEHLNLYIGSGRCGASFDAYGLMNSGFRGRPAANPGRTVIMHADHWHRGAYGLDYWLPVARLAWDEEPPGPPVAYRQEQALYDGRLRTEMAWPGLRLAIAATFHPEQRDLLAVEVSYEAAATGAMPALVLATETQVKTHYDQSLAGQAESLALDSAAGWWLGQVRVGTADSVVALRVLSSYGTAPLGASPDGVRVRFEGERGRHLLLIGTAGAARREELCSAMHSVGAPEEFLAEAAQAWHRRWGEAYVRVPVPEYQALWARSLSYVLASYAPDVRSPAAPMGWSGNGWPFHFPQDVSYIHPALLRLGHLDIARAWVEFYHSRLANMMDATRRIYGAEGAMWAWEFPIGPDSQFLSEGTPNWFQFEIHNAAYPARMAREAALYARDRQWSEEIAWPVVRESARFLGSILQREGDGTWGIHVVPSMGQDEMGGKDARNYLCALFSAKYALQSALAMGAELGIEEPEFARWRGVLADGLAFGRLYDAAEGIYVTCEGNKGSEQVGNEKHPVQLNPLTFLPLGEPDAPLRRAYERRYDLCAGVKRGHFHGWTLADYWLASSHLGDAAGLLRGLGEALPGRYVDPDWIQIYETSGSLHMPFYVTSHGLALQALNDALVSDYWGPTQIGAACPDAWQEVSFHHLHTADGHVLSGRRAGEAWEVTHG